MMSSLAAEMTWPEDGDQLIHLFVEMPFQTNNKYHLKMEYTPCQK